MAEDQGDRTPGKYWPDSPNGFYGGKLFGELYKRDLRRSNKLLEILEEIKTPSVRNIGLDGSRAVWFIANHSPSLEIARKVLKAMQGVYRRDKAQVFYPGIPYLVDYTMLLARKFDHAAKQLYGTRYYYISYEDGSSKTGNFPIIDEPKLALRRKKFDLSPGPNYAERCKHRNG